MNAGTVRESWNRISRYLAERDGFDHDDIRIVTAALAAQPDAQEPTEDGWYWFQGVRHGRLDRNEMIDYPVCVFRGTVQMNHGEYSRADFDGKFYRIASPAPYFPPAAE